MSEDFDIVSYIGEWMDDLAEEVEAFTDEEIPKLLVSLHHGANIILMEAKRRGILEQVMKQAMTLDGAPAQN